MLNQNAIEKPILYVDADITAYKAASGRNKETGAHYTAAEACDAVDRHMKFLMEYLNGDSLVCCLTDAVNFRRDVYPMYKANRIGKPTPVILSTVRQYIRDNYFTIELPRLEADDVIGMLVTGNKSFGIICSSDKDFGQVPNSHRFNSDNWRDGLIITSAWEAELFFYKQVITGDTVDGYGGVPNVGPVGADTFLKNFLGKSGGTLDGIWPAIVELYKKYGVDEAYALNQARCARILREGDYDYATGEVKLWTPPV